MVESGEVGLLTLASDPSLLALIYQRLAPDPTIRVTRNQLSQEYLDRQLSGAIPRFTLGDAFEFTHAESSYLQIAMENGLVALLLAIGGIALTAVWCLQGLL